MDNDLQLIAALEKERDDLLNEVSSIEQLILKIRKRNGLMVTDKVQHQQPNGKANGHAAGTSASIIDNKYRAYYAAKNNRDKAVAILKAEGRFLHIREIVEITQKLEPNADANAIKSKMSQAIYGLKALENSPLVSYSPNKSLLNVFWGSKNWLNDKGEIKPEHMYDEKQISTSKTDTIEI